MDKVKPSIQKKQVIVAEVADKVGKAKIMVFTNYQGMTHKQLEEFKKALRTVNAELVVVKNTLLKRALGEKAEGIDLNLPTATLFAYEDPIAPLKELAKLIKTLQLPHIKQGYFEGKVVTETDVMKLSTLPSREVLLGQLVGTLKSPIYGLHRALNWNIQKLVLTLSAIQKTKPQ